MKHIIISFLLLLSVSTISHGQNEDQQKKIDTFKINTFATDLDLLFYLTQREMNTKSDLKIVNTFQVRYVQKETEFGLYFRQVYDRLSSIYTYHNHYLNLSAGIFKYKSLERKSPFIHLLHPEPVFIFQNNSGRSLSRRFQTGLFFYPLRHFSPNFAINLGIGGLHDWSSWDVNNYNKIMMLPDAIRDKIIFVNSHSELRNDRYLDHSEWRPTVYLSLTCNLNNTLLMSLISSYQQSVVSPFSKEITDVYPELKKVYPYSYTNLAIAARVNKGISLKTSFILDYEKNNLSIYDSSWEYSIIFGVAWNFTGKKYISIR